MCLVEVEGSPKPVSFVLRLPLYSLPRVQQASVQTSRSSPSQRKHVLLEGKYPNQQLSGHQIQVLLQVVQIELVTDTRFLFDFNQRNYYYSGVMEFLLANHPLDCPICDQGGECDL